MDAYSEENMKKKKPAQGGDSGDPVVCYPLRYLKCFIFIHLGLGGI